MSAAIHHATLYGSRHRVNFSRWRNDQAPSRIQRQVGSYAEVTTACGLAGSTPQWIDRSGSGNLDRSAPFCSDCWDKSDPPAGIVGDARFSPDGQHRLSLSRTWLPKLGRVVFIGLNPSRANTTTPDQTVSKMIGYADRWSYGEIVVVNLYSYVATHQTDLWALPPEARRDVTWREALRESLGGPGRVVLCWGALPRAAQADADTLVDELQENRVPLWCLGRTGDGFPRHPARLPYDTRCERWSST